MDASTSLVLGEDPLSTSLVIVPGNFITSGSLRLSYTVTYNATVADGRDESTASSLTQVLLCNRAIDIENPRIFIGPIRGDVFGFEQAGYFYPR